MVVVAPNAVRPPIDAVLSVTVCGGRGAEWLLRRPHGQIATVSQYASLFQVHA